MSWGYKIMLAYLVFIGGIALLVVMSVKEKQELVTNDYYEQELKFQDKINEVENANSLSAKIMIEATGNEITFFFPQEMKGITIQSDIMMYSPSSILKDRHLTGNTTDGKLGFKNQKISTGNYTCKISWTASGKKYYDERKITVK